MLAGTQPRFWRPKEDGRVNKKGCASERSRLSPEARRPRGDVREAEEGVSRQRALIRGGKKEVKGFEIAGLWGAEHALSNLLHSQPRNPEGNPAFQVMQTAFYGVSYVNP